MGTFDAFAKELAFAAFAWKATMEADGQACEEPPTLFDSPKQENFGE
ncbi:MAG: hypothetical protein IJS32_02715 [Kiritimatiellae bacterium]|nr:hypothetical protein [Kiritimatiellia bacterium]